MRWLRADGAAASEVRGVDETRLRGPAIERGLAKCCGCVEAAATERAVDAGSTPVDRCVGTESARPAAESDRAEEASGGACGGALSERDDGVGPRADPTAMRADSTAARADPTATRADSTVPGPGANREEVDSREAGAAGCDIEAVSAER